MLAHCLFAPPPFGKGARFAFGFAEMDERVYFNYLSFFVWIIWFGFGCFVFYFHLLFFIIALSPQMLRIFPPFNKGGYGN